MKKILSSILLLIFVLTSTWLVNAAESNDEYYLRQKVLTTKSKVPYEKYITLVDGFIRKIGEKEDLLKNAKNKMPAVKVAINKIADSDKRKKMLYVIDYLEANIDLAIFKIENNVLRKFENTDISDKDTKKVEDKIVKIQLNLLENGIDNLKSITDKFNKLSNYEEKWDFKMNLDIDHETIWKIKAGLELPDYVSSTSNFDSQLKWKIKAFIDAMPKWEKAVKLEISSMMDFISKDGNIYLLLDNLNVSEENIGEVKSAIQVLKKIAEEKGYIKIENKNSFNIISVLKGLNPNNILRDWKVALSKPMLKPYKKEGNRYYLMPTKYACDKMKELTYRFDPFGWTTCTESQYNRVLEELG